MLQLALTHAGFHGWRHCLIRSGDLAEGWKGRDDPVEVVVVRSPAASSEPQPIPNSTRVSGAVVATSRAQVTCGSSHDESLHLTAVNRTMRPNVEVQCR